MGNNQSNERRRNYKICKITRVDESLRWIKCHLDDYVPYRNGNQEYMFFVKHSETSHFFNLVSMGLTGINSLPSAVLQEGSYIAIDTDMTKEHDSSYDFGRDSVKTVGIEKEDDYGNNIIEAVGGWCDEIVRHRMERAERVQQLRFQREMQAWHLEPPKR